MYIVFFGISLEAKLHTCVIKVVLLEDCDSSYIIFYFTTV